MPPDLRRVRKPLARRRSITVSSVVRAWPDCSAKCAATSRTEMGWWSEMYCRTSSSRGPRGSRGAGMRMVSRCDYQRRHCTVTMVVVNIMVKCILQTVPPGPLTGVAPLGRGGCIIGFRRLPNGRGDGNKKHKVFASEGRNMKPTVCIAMAVLLLGGVLSLAFETREVRGRVLDEQGGPAANIDV